MTEQEFKDLSLSAKWDLLNNTIRYIVRIDTLYSMSRNKVAKDSKEEVRNTRVDQCQRWQHVKSLYAACRDEMTDTLGIPEFEETKRILEAVFTAEVDDALRNILQDDS